MKKNAIVKTSRNRVLFARQLNCRLPTSLSSENDISVFEAAHDHFERGVSGYLPESIFKVYPLGATFFEMVDGRFLEKRGGWE